MVDTGSSHTIVRPNIIAHCKTSPPPNYVLELANGEEVPIIAEHEASIMIGSTRFKHKVLVANISDEAIIGLDAMAKQRFKLDIFNRILKTQSEEILMKRSSSENITTRNVIVLEDVILPAMSESVIKATCDAVDGETLMIEPKEDCHLSKTGVLTARTLTTKQGPLIFVRVANLKSQGHPLVKGEIIGTCCEIQAVVRNMKRPSFSKKLPENLENILAMSNDHLDSVQQHQLRQIIAQYHDVFSTTDTDMGRTDKVQHRIDTGDSPPIKQAPRRIPFAQQEEVEIMLRDMEQSGVIEESQSPWTSPVVLVKKKDGSTRFCVDYRRLNSVTKKDSYPLPRIDDTLDTLTGSKWFSTLDLKSGYWQVAVHPQDREKTAFSTGNGLWQFKVMPFGLCNAPATFERLMETVLRGMTWKTCLVYLDDVIILGKSFDDHLKNIREILQKMREAGLKLNSKKCCFLQKEVKYLGHVISENGVRTDPIKIDAVSRWPCPKDVHELRSFLGLCTYYRRFVRNFANIAKPLHRLTEDNRDFDWNDECDEAFQSLKKALCSAPILTFPVPGKTFILDTDASNFGIGAVLSQESEGREQVIAYFSKVLSKPEKNYCVTRRELLAVVKAVKHFHKYLYGQRFVLRTDHASLRWLFQFKNPEGQVARWLQQLQEYDFEIRHRKGEQHKNADTLSRRPCCEDCHHCRRQELKNPPVASGCKRTVLRGPENWRVDVIAEEQNEDPNIGFIYNLKKADASRPVWSDLSGKSPEVKAYWAQWDSLVMKDGLLKRVWESPDGRESTFLTVLPKKRVPEVLEAVHNGIGGGHFGVNKTLEKAKERFYWVNSRQDVEEWCRQCKDCASTKGPKTRTRGRMMQYLVGTPFERIAIDIAGPFPKSKAGNRYILVAMDYFSKWPEVYAIPNQEAVTIAEVLFQNWICRYGIPLELHSDQGRNFESEVFQNLCRLLGIAKTRTTPLHPQSDGMVERFNKTLGTYLKIVIDQQQSNWDTCIQPFLLAYRSAKHNSTGRTPAQLVFGRDLRLPVDITVGRPDAPESTDDYLGHLRERLQVVHEEARQKLQLESDRMKTRYDIKANSDGFNIGDKVWLFNPQRRKGRSPKLQRSWEGPYTIVTKLNDIVYRIQRGPTAKKKIVNISRLCRYQEDKVPGSVT